jgi:hypothetical protein
MFRAQYESNRAKACAHMPPSFMILHYLIASSFRRACASEFWFSSLSLLLLCAGCATKQTSPPQAANEAPREKEPAPAAPAPEHPKPDERLKQVAAQAPAPFPEDGWHAMFNGQSLSGWRETQFAGRGEVRVELGLIAMNMGDPFTGINWTNDFPKINYEIALDAMRVSGSDFFCGLTAPVQESFFSLIVGGWGGALVGISSLNHLDASENETTKYVTFEQYRWYRIRLRVTEKKLEAWIDQDKLVDVDISDQQIALRPGDIEMSKPFGLACWQTSAAYREIKWRPVNGPATPVK